MGTKKVQDLFDESGRFVLKRFDELPPFSNFLPGIAGLNGIPMWVFYTNRGQAISSFGVESKDRPIMEFQSANNSYRLTSLSGFRTFLKINGEIIEPFSPLSERDVQRVMFVGMNEVEIRETDRVYGIETRVFYSTLVDERCAGLIRRVQVRNIGRKSMAIEMLDGMPALVPYGVDNGLLKHIGRTIEAWMEVFNLETRLPFYRLRASAEDTSDVRRIQAGNFALGFSAGKRLSALVDPVVVFGQDTAFIRPQGFMRQSLDDLLMERQVTVGRMPCAFFGRTVTLGVSEQDDMISVFGYSKDEDVLQELALRLEAPGFFERQQTSARQLAESLTDPIETRSGDQRFDAYCRQTFLDNLMRGGWPQLLADRHVYHVYSRKHGDPERDYNHYFLAAEYFSQGNGNYRDVNQNRRSDVLFEPRSADFNIRLFMSLIQTDGYNPLVVEGTHFILPETHHAEVLNCVEKPEKLRGLLAGNFTPGQLLSRAQEAGLNVSSQQFLQTVFGAAEQHIQAQFGEGYWVDHWLYNLDLLEAYERIYPEKISDLLFHEDPLPFFDSPALVRPRSEKYVLDGAHPRQYNAIHESEGKHALIKSRATAPNWVRTENGQGEIFRVPLISKLLLLAILKFSTRDPSGMGVEMEAGRPGWYDALNGLPGLLGSSTPESFELQRLLHELVAWIRAFPEKVELHIEAYSLLKQVAEYLEQDMSELDYWDAVSTAREQYREQTKMGVSGEIAHLNPGELLPILQRMQKRVQAGLDRAVSLGDGIAPTYFYFNVTDYEKTDRLDGEGRPIIRPLQFELVQLPYFLEGPVHQMKTLATSAERAALERKVRESRLFDNALKMYRVNTSLDEQPFEIGRARAFSRGWLENESIWMHMAYKYLLELLKAGLYEAFYRDLKAGIPPMMDQTVYGRSPLENSSFIVSSAHPDPKLHGRGFVARLSGSTAEFLDIWFRMMTGGRPFKVRADGRLGFSIQPKLPGWLFDEEGTLAFRFLGHTNVRILNPDTRDTWDATIRGYRLHTVDEGDMYLTGSELSGEIAHRIRNGDFDQIDVDLA